MADLSLEIICQKIMKHLKISKKTRNDDYESRNQTSRESMKSKDSFQRTKKTDKPPAGEIEKECLLYTHYVLLYTEYIINRAYCTGTGNYTQ